MYDVTVVTSWNSRGSLLKPGTERNIPNSPTAPTPPLEDLRPKVEHRGLQFDMIQDFG